VRFKLIRPHIVHVASWNEYGTIGAYELMRQVKSLAQATATSVSVSSQLATHFVDESDADDAAIVNITGTSEYDDDEELYQPNHLLVSVIVDGHVSQPVHRALLALPRIASVLVAAGLDPDASQLGAGTDKNDRLTVLANGRIAVHVQRAVVLPKAIPRVVDGFVVVVTDTAASAAVLDDTDWAEASFHQTSTAALFVEVDITMSGTAGDLTHRRMRLGLELPSIGAYLAAIGFDDATLSKDSLATIEDSLDKVGNYFHGRRWYTIKLSLGEKALH
jgi:hypothetical protein